MFTEFWETLIVPQHFMPHGHCYHWQPQLVVLHALSDFITFISYMTIPLMMAYLSRHRQDLPFRGLFLSFVAFISFCGLTHLCEVWTLWQPAYWVSGTMKAATAASSAITAVLLARSLPSILAIPSESDLREAYEKLEDSERRFRTAIAQMQDGFVILEPIRDKGAIVDFAIRHVNSTSAAYTNQSPHQLVDQPLSSSPMWALPPFARLSAVVDGESNSGVVIPPTLSGELLLQHEVVNMGNEGVLVVTRDRTRELEAAATRERLARFIESSTDAVISITRNGIVDSWNQGAVHLIDIPTQKAVGASIFSLLRFSGEGNDEIQDVLGGGAPRTREDQLSPLGIPVSLRISSLRAPDHSVEGAVIVMRDLTDIKQASQLRRSLALQDTMLHEIHHRVKNNLQVVSSLLNMAVRQMEMGKLDPRSALEESRDRVWAIALLHEHLNSISDLKAMPLGDYLRQLTQRLFSSLAQQDSQELMVDAGGVVLPMEQAMPLGLIVNELVSNAFTHGLRAQPGQVHIHLFCSQELFILRVSDNGVPFPTDFHLPGPRLGLTLVDSLVRQLGGEWTFHNTPDKNISVSWPAHHGE